MAEDTQRWQLALQELTAELRALYGERLQAIILYGSRARGDADDESDVDVLVVLEPLGDFWEEFGRIGAIASRLSLRYDELLSVIPVSQQEYEIGASLFFANVRREGAAVG